MLGRSPLVLLIASALLALLLSACGTVLASDSQFTPLSAYITPTRTAFPTLSPLPTFTPSPTPPATATPPPSPTPPMCPISDLRYNQHLSAIGSYTQSEWDAIGPMVCRIERNSCAFHLLIGFSDPNIMTKGEEPYPYSLEDGMIHPDMLAPLMRLSEMVQEEWDGEIKLRVTDAYDSLLTDHDLSQPDLDKKVAHHYEGRSIDLTTYPVRPELYGRLCSLAHCAGFHWVHNEGDHCHASISAPSLCLQCRR